MMNYLSFINQAVDAVVKVDEHTGIAYLEPAYKFMLKCLGLNCTDISDTYPVTEDEVYELLHLAVDKINARNDKSKAMMNWLYDTITEKVEPIVTEEENALVKNVIEYMTLNHSLKDKEKALEVKEASLNTKEDLAKKTITGLNFSKRNK